MRFRGVHVLAAAVVCGGLVAAPAASADDGTTAAEAHGWGTPVAGDEFDGTAVDESIWDRYGDYPGHNGNGMRLKSHDTVAGGHLTISGDADTTFCRLAEEETPAIGRPHRQHEHPGRGRRAVPPHRRPLPLRA